MKKDNIIELLIKILGNKFYFGIYEIIMSLPFYFFRVFPIKRNKIVFCNFDGKGYGDNPKYIAEELIKKGFTCDLVWLADRNLKQQFPSHIRVIDIRSLKAVFELVTAKIWVDNGRKSFITRKRKNQFYIQTWHACMMIKKVEKDAEDKLPFLYKRSAINDSKMINLCVSNSNFMTNFLRTSFWYNGIILQCGYPKTDYILNSSDENVINIKRKLELNKEHKILLYAPTFRIDKSIDVYISEFDKLLESLGTKFGGQWVVLLRLHPSMSEKSSMFCYSENIINVSDYSDMQDLIIISDLLITDYSSTMFEFYLLNKPVLLYATDVNEYEKDRGFYFDFYNLPFPKANNYEDLLKIISDFDNIAYFKSINLFMDDIGFSENGASCEKIIFSIKSVLN